ncbi:MAG: helix-turn-helix domain-containing protein [Mycobacterium sp.]
MGGSTSAKRLLGTALRDLRTQRGQSQDQVARVLKCGTTKIKNIESGRNPIGPLELSVLATHYGLSEKQLAELERLRAQATQRGWWSNLRSSRDPIPAGPTRTG